MRQIIGTTMVMLILVLIWHDEEEGDDLDEAALGVDHHRLKDRLLGRQRWGSHVTSTPVLKHQDTILMIITLQFSR